jgi:hypothetical protein
MVFRAFRVCPELVERQELVADHLLRLLAVAEVVAEAVAAPFLKSTPRLKLQNILKIITINQLVCPNIILG